MKDILIKKERIRLMKKHILALILSGAVILLTGCPNTENNNTEDEKLQPTEHSVSEPNTNESADEKEELVPSESKDKNQTELNTENNEQQEHPSNPDNITTPEDEPYEWVDPDEITYDNSEEEHICENDPTPIPPDPIPMPISPQPGYDYKPVIYLYPEETTEISVKLDYNGTLTTTYPQYIDGWQVTAESDGTIHYNGREYYCLFWEGISNVNYSLDKGFCIKGEDTEEFLEKALKEMGLTDKEANEFIIFWLPKMENNAYNIISFQEEIYTENAQLTVSPAPDTLIRVFMAWKSSDTFVEIEPQELSAPERNGFTVIEWGGSELN